jgi:hypothetical protein
LILSKASTTAAPRNSAWRDWSATRYGRTPLRANLLGIRARGGCVLELCPSRISLGLRSRGPGRSSRTGWTGWTCWTRCADWAHGACNTRIALVALVSLRSGRPGGAFKTSGDR